MRIFTVAFMLGGAVLASPAIASAQSFVVDSITFKGNSLVSTDKLQAAVKETVGSKVTVADIKADNDAIGDVYKANHVSVTLKPGYLASKKNPGHITVIFTVVEQGVAQNTTLPPTAPKLRQMQFIGNQKIDTATLMGIAGLKPGDALTDATIDDAQKKIGDYYKSKHIDMTLQEQNQNNNDGTYDVIWTISKEKKVRKQEKDSDGGINVDD